jgi:hypothetical protein
MFFCCVLKLSLLGPNLHKFKNTPKAHELFGMCSYLLLISFSKFKGYINLSNIDKLDFCKRTLFHFIIIYLVENWHVNYFFMHLHYFFYNFDEAYV